MITFVISQYTQTSNLSIVKEHHAEHGTRTQGSSLGVPIKSIPTCSTFFHTSPSFRHPPFNLLVNATNLAMVARRECPAHSVALLAPVLTCPVDATYLAMVARRECVLHTVLPIDVTLVSPPEPPSSKTVEKEMLESPGECDRMSSMSTLLLSRRHNGFRSEI